MLAHAWSNTYGTLLPYGYGLARRGIVMSSVAVGRAAAVGGKPLSAPSAFVRWTTVTAKCVAAQRLLHSPFAAQGHEDRDPVQVGLRRSGQARSVHTLLHGRRCVLCHILPISQLQEIVLDAPVRLAS